MTDLDVDLAHFGVEVAKFIVDSILEDAQQQVLSSM
jgi:hypothetical protein